MYEEIKTELIWDELEKGEELTVVILPNDKNYRARVTSTDKIAAGLIQSLIEDVPDCTKFYKKVGA